MSRPTRRLLDTAALLSLCCLCLGSGLVSPAVAAWETNAIRLRVEPVSVKKNGTARLTAIVVSTGTCTDRAVLFEIKEGDGWAKRGRKVDVDSSCDVSRKVKIERTSVFRVLLIDARKSTTLVTSPDVTVKLR